MKSFRSTAVLMVVVALLAGYTYYEFKNAEKDAQEKMGQRPAVGMPHQKIQEVRLTHRGGTILLRKDGEKWKLIEPVEDLAEGPSVEGFLYSLANEKFKEFRGEDESQEIKWEEFGLDKPLVTVQISGGGDAESFDISTKNAFDGSYYVRKGEDLLLADRGLAQLAEREASSFRSRQIWREDDAQIERIQVATDVDGTREKFTLVKQGESWTIEPQPAFATDSAKISAWADRLTDLLPSDFIQEGIEEEDRRRFLLTKPSLVAGVGFKKGDGSAGEWVLTVGQDQAEDVYLFTNQRPTVYKTSSGSLSLVRVPIEYFRAGKPPFAVPVEQARRVEVETPKLKRTIVKQDEAWALAGDSDGLELNQEKLVQLFQDIRSLEAQEFVNSGKGFPPTPQVVVKDTGGGVLFSLSWGDEYKALKPYNRGAAYRYVKTNLEKQVMGVPKEKLDRLIDEGMFKKKEAESAPTAAAAKNSESK